MLGQRLQNLARRLPALGWNVQRSEPNSLRSLFCRRKASVLGAEGMSADKRQPDTG